MAMYEIDIDQPTTRTYKTKENLIKGLERLMPPNTDIRYVAVPVRDRWTAIIFCDMDVALYFANNGFRVQA